MFAKFFFSCFMTIKIYLNVTSCEPGIWLRFGEKGWITRRARRNSRTKGAICPFPSLPPPILLRLVSFLSLPHQGFGLRPRIERFHMTSRRPYWCSKTMKRRPCWCTKKILVELFSNVNAFLCSNKLA